MQPQRKVTFVLTLLLLFSTTAWTQAISNSGLTVYGRLIRESGVSLNETCSVFLYLNGARVASTFSDGSGHFTFHNVQGGSYSVQAELEGYEDIAQPLDVNDWMSSTITITLVRKTRLIRTGDATSIHISEFLERYPKKAVDAYKKAMDAQSRDKIGEAIKSLEYAVKIAPEFFRAHNSLGLVYRRAGRADEAETEFLRAHYLNASSADPLVNLTSLYINENKLDLAVSAGEQATKADARSAPALYNLGIALYKTGKLEKAEAVLNKALTLTPKVAEVRLMLANIYLKLHKYDSLMEQLVEYLRDNPRGEERKHVEEMRQALLSVQAAQNVE